MIDDNYYNPVSLLKHKKVGHTITKILLNSSKFLMKFLKTIISVGRHTHTCYVHKCSLYYTNDFPKLVSFKIIS